VTDIYVPRPGYGGINVDRCRASVWDNWHSHQCARKAVIHRDVDGKPHGFCKQHDPEAVAAKRKAEDERRVVESAARTARWELDARRHKALPKALATLQAIAAGHNDARAHAAEALALIGDLQLEATNG
jgi:hypothetical protein